MSVAEKPSEKWGKKYLINDEAYTDIYMADVKPIIADFEALESERDTLKESRGKAISEGELWRLHWVEAEAEVKALKTELEECKLYSQKKSDNMQGLMNKFIGAESKLLKAQEWVVNVRANPNGLGTWIIKKSSINLRRLWGRVNK